MKRAFGVDVGGTGIKAAVVDTTSGELLTERLRVDTPHHGKPKPVAEAIAGLAKQAEWSGPIGVCFPAVIQHGVAKTAANVDKTWIGRNVTDIVGNATGEKITAINDADAAGLAEVRFGAAKGIPGTVLMVTLGTGIGTALFVDGRLVPNTELGHIHLHHGDAEHYAAESAKVREDLSYEKWAERVQKYIHHLDALIWPDLIVFGGGISKKAEHWLPLIDARPDLVPAHLFNEAGIVGAAMAKAEY